MRPTPPERLTPFAAALLVSLVAAGTAAAGTPAAEPLTRTSRPGAGTIVGITVAGPAPDGAVEAAYAELARWEAELSEWQPSSATSRVMNGEVVALAPEALHLLDVADDLRVRTGGAFSIVRSGGPLIRDGDRVSAPAGTRIDLGGVLKGFLADRAAEELIAQGVTNFVVDAGGDVVAHGSCGDGRPGWPVTVAVAGVSRRIRLRDEALSTSGEDQQPGHIVDRRSGAPVHTLRGVFVRATEGVMADGLATAVYASGGDLTLPPGQCVAWIGKRGHVRTVCTARSEKWRAVRKARG